MAADVTASEPPALGGRMTLEVQGIHRSYLLFVPSDHDPTEPAPLVLNSHGGVSSAGAQRVQTNFDEIAEREGIIVAYPNAAGGVWDFDDGAGMDRSDVHDVEFISAVIDDVGSRMALDPDRIYAVGFSQGSGFSAFLACHLPDRIAAIAEVAALMRVDGPACPEPTAQRVLGIVGEADPITIRGRRGLPFADLPGPLTEEAAAWAATNSCDPAPEEEEALPGEATRFGYSCGGDAALVIYTHPGGHVWPAEVAPGLETNTIIWEFLSQYTGPVKAD